MADEKEEYELVSDPKAKPKPEEKALVTEPVTVVGTVEDVPAGTIKNALVKLNVTDASLVTLRGEVDAILDKWDGSKASYEAVKSKRNSIVRTLRTPLVNEAKEGREEAIKVQRLWINAEKAVTGFYITEEERLKAKEVEYETKRAKEAEENARVQRERVEGLLAQLKAYEWPGNALIVAQMKPEEFTDELAKAKARFEELAALRKAEVDRKAKEEKEAAELAERNKAEQTRLAKVAEDQKAEQDRLDAAKRQQEAENARALQEIEDQKADALKEIKDAKDKADEEARLAKEKSDQAERERVEAEKKKADESEKERLRDLNAPDREKVLVWADKIDAVLSQAPILSDQALNKAVVTFHGGIMGYAVALRQSAQ